MGSVGVSGSDAALVCDIADCVVAVAATGLALVGTKGTRG